MKTVSIIVPVYNVEKYLDQCLLSIQRQTYTDWQAILIDDGSADQSGLICDRYAEKDSRFHVIHQNNCGAANAKNKGLDYVNSAYIAFVDSDDYVETFWLEEAINILTNEQADIVEYGFDSIYKNHVENSLIYKKEFEIFDAETYLKQYPNNWASSLFWNKVFKAELIEDIRFRKERRCIDDEFFTYKVITKAKKLVRIDRILYHYRQRLSGAVFNSANKKQILDDALEVLIERYEWINKYFPALKKVYLKHDVNIMFYFAEQPHDTGSIRKFRKTSRYYLKEALLCITDIKTVISAVKLQFISDRLLQNTDTQPIQMNDVKEYYE